VHALHEVRKTFRKRVPAFKWGEQLELRWEPL
jgi:hypothetical protein